MNVTSIKNSIFSRPADQQYKSIEDFLTDAENDRNACQNFVVEAKSIYWSHDQDDKLSASTGGNFYELTCLALSQSASMAKIPMAVLKRLYDLGHAGQVARNINLLFPKSSDKRQLLVKDGTHLRALNGADYSRLWDSTVFSEADDWLTPRDFSHKVPLHYGSNCPTLLGSTREGLYRGDQSSFAFFFHNNNLSSQTKSLGNLKPGIMIWNSEVGARSFGFHTFYYHEATSSLIIWTPSKHKRKRFVHRGDITKGFNEYMGTLEDMCDNYEERYTNDIAHFTKALNKDFASCDEQATQKLRERYKMSSADAKAVVSRAGSIHVGSSLNVWRIALAVATEAAITSRAESMVDNSMVANKILKLERI